MLLKIDGFKLQCAIADRGETVLSVSDHTGVATGTIRRMISGLRVRSDCVGAVVQCLKIKTEDIAIKE